MYFGEVPRAWRYQMSFSIQYRPEKDGRWHTGIAHNISASGVLFGETEGDECLEQNAPVEMELIIPSDLVEGGTRVFCVGRVSRIVEPPSLAKHRVIAATIARYRLLRARPRSANQKSESG